MDWIGRYWIEVLFAAIVAGLGMAYRYLISKMKVNKAEQDAICDGVKALLRDRIIQGYNYYYHGKGACPMYAMDSLQEMYRAYHDLGGNGTISKLMDDIAGLPTEKKGDE